MDNNGPGAGVERPSDFPTSVARWDAELVAAEKVTEKWMKDAKRISDRYILDKRNSEQIDFWGAPQGDFNILHSNVQTMLPAIFGQEPMPVIVRRHRDKDPIGRVAAEMWERAVKTELENDNFFDSMSRVALDLLLCGRGSAWVRFEPEFTQTEQGEALAGAKSPVDYVLWSDFLHAPKTTWAEVVKEGWVARRVSMTRDMGLRRFGEIFKEVPLGESGPGHDLDDVGDREREVIGRASVWEIWDAASKQVIWICRDYQDRVLDIRPDSLSLDGFFPCPMPAFGTMGNNMLVPTPDYLQYEKLADELDRQTAKISVLTDALRVSGIYDASMEGLGQLLEDDGEDQNRLIPVTNFQAIQGVGLDGAIQFLPLGAIAEALVGLYDARERTKQVLYEVSGLSDIMRGQVDPREKLGQSRLKGQFASQRLQSKVRVMEQVAKGAIAIKAEIIAEHYDPQFIRQLSGFDFIPEVERLKQQQPEAVEHVFGLAMQLLRDEKTRGFRIDVETNSTILIDDDEEKQRRVEFLDSAGNFLERALPVAMQVPSLAPLMADMLLFSVRGFRAGRQLESSFEEAVETLKADQQQPEEEGPSPEEQQAQMEMQMAQQKAEIDMQATQAKAQNDAQSAQLDLQVKMMEIQSKVREIEAKSQAEEQKVQMEAAMTAAEIETKMAELDIEREKLAMNLEASRQGALVDIAKSEATKKEVSND